MNLTHLEMLEIMFNGVTGDFLVTGLDKLKWIKSGSNEFSGNLPPVGGCVVDITLSDNLFSGTVPREWESLPKLETVHLQNNQLSGKLPGPLHEGILLLLTILGGRQLVANWSTFF